MTHPANKARDHRRNVRTETQKFIIWCAAESRGWDLTVRELADMVDMIPQRVGRICAAAGWTHRLRSHLIDTTGMFISAIED